MRRGALATLLGLSLTAPSFAADGPGTTGSPFLKIPISGRAAGLASTLGADTGDIASLDYNPAAINGIDRIDIMATYVSYFEQTSLQAASIGFPVDLASMPPQQEVMQGAEFTPQRLQVGVEYRQFKADDTSRSALLGAKGDTFNIRSQLFEFALAYPITSRIGIGAAGKLISDAVESKTAKSNAGDVGITAKLSSRWTIAAAVQNLGSSGKFDTQSDPLPRQTRGSLSYNSGDLLVLADVAAGADGLVRTAAGLEWSLGSIVRLRAGAYHDTDLEFSGGLGLRLHGPQKARRAVMRPPSSAAEPAGSSLSVIAQSIIEKSAAKLINAALDSKLLTAPSPIAIYPLNSSDTSGNVISDVYAAQFKKSHDFAVLGTTNRDHSDTMLVGNVEDQGETLRVNTRLVMSDTADTLATDHFDIAKEDLYLHRKPTLESARTVQTVSSSIEPQTFSTLDLGLDYGLTTSKDLGLTHTISLKILY